MAGAGSTAKAAGVNPKTDLRDVLLRIAEESDVSKLTPHGWKERFEQSVEDEHLAAVNAFIGV